MIDKTKASIQEIFITQNWTLSVAESCTGGAIAAELVEQEGASNYFSGGVVAYTEEIKKSLINVKSETLDKYGVISVEVAEEMAKGVKEEFNSHWAVATTGLAGPADPETGQTEPPIGTVCLAVVGPKIVWSKECNFSRGVSAKASDKAKSRIEVIKSATDFALQSLLKLSS